MIAPRSRERCATASPTGSPLFLRSYVIDFTTPDDGRDLDSDGLTERDKRARQSEKRLREMRGNGEISGGYGYGAFER